MPDESSQYDAEIIFSAYADRVKEAFKIFADNLGIGENERSSRERFARALLIMRRARDLALQTVTGENVEEATEKTEFADKNRAPEPAETAKEGEAEVPAGPLSAEHQALVDKALAGTRGAAAPYRRR